MLSRDLLRDDPERVRQALANRKMEPTLLDDWLRLDAERRSELVEVEELKRQRNEASRAIGKVKQQGGDASAEMAAVNQMKQRIEELEARLAGLEPEASALEMTFPNLPHESVPVGADESANRVERTVGRPRRFDFEPKAHWDLGTALGILDFERGAKGGRRPLHRLLRGRRPPGARADQLHARPPHPRARVHRGRCRRSSSTATA